MERRNHALGGGGRSGRLSSCSVPSTLSGGGFWVTARAMLASLSSEAERELQEVKPRSGPVAQQRCRALCDMESTERLQLRPGVELARKECGPLGGGRKGNKWKETGLCWMPGSS